MIPQMDLFSPAQRALTDSASSPMEEIAPVADFLQALAARSLAPEEKPVHGPAPQRAARPARRADEDAPQPVVCPDSVPPQSNRASIQPAKDRPDKDAAAEKASATVAAPPDTGGAYPSGRPVQAHDAADTAATDSPALPGSQEAQADAAQNGPSSQEPQMPDRIALAEEVPAAPTADSAPAQPGDKAEVDLPAGFTKPSEILHSEQPLVEISREASTGDGEQSDAPAPAMAAAAPKEGTARTPQPMLRSDYSHAAAILTWKAAETAPRPVPPSGHARAENSDDDTVDFVGPTRPIPGPQPSPLPMAVVPPVAALASGRAGAEPGLTGDEVADAIVPVSQDPAAFLVLQGQAHAWSGPPGVAAAGAGRLPAAFHPLVTAIRHHVGAGGIGQTAQTGTELVLNPIELGRVRFALVGSGEHLVLSVMAEKTETLALLQRHATELRAELQREGLGQANLSFSGWGQEGSASSAARWLASETPQAEDAPLAPGPAEPRRPSPSRAAPEGGLDLRI